VGIVEYMSQSHALFCASPLGFRSEAIPHLIIDGCLVSVPAAVERCVRSSADPALPTNTCGHGAEPFLHLLSFGYFLSFEVIDLPSALPINLESYRS